MIHSSNTNQLNGTANGIRNAPRSSDVIVRAQAHHRHISSIADPYYQGGTDDRSAQRRSDTAPCALPPPKIPSHTTHSRSGVSREKVAAEMSMIYWIDRLGIPITRLRSARRRSSKEWRAKSSSGHRHYPCSQCWDSFAANSSSCQRSTCC